MKLIIEGEPGKTWKVEVGDRYADELTFDEALGTAAQFLLAQETRYLKTQKEWDAFEERCALMRADRESKVNEIK